MQPVNEQSSTSSSHGTTRMHPVKLNVTPFSKELYQFLSRTQALAAIGAEKQGCSAQPSPSRRRKRSSSSASSSSSNDRVSASGSGKEATVGTAAAAAVEVPSSSPSTGAVDAVNTKKKPSRASAASKKRK